MADIYQMMKDAQASGERGYAQGQQRGLAKLMSSAMQAPRDQRRAIVSQMAATSPEAAFSADDYFAKQDDNARAEMGRHALAFDALPDDQKAAAYPRFAMEMQRMGLPAPPQWDPAYAPRIKQFASAWGGAGADAQNTVQSRFVGEDGQVYVVMRDGSMRPLGVQADRQMWLRDFPGMAPELVGKDGMVRPVGAGPTQAPQGNPFDSFATAFPGVQVTSGLRSPAHNREVGGVDNSYHLTNQARDIAPPKTPQEAAALRAWGAANGIEWIDEGDHWHGEPKGRAPHVMQGAQARPSEAQVAADTEVAKQTVQTQFLPEQERIKADAAVRQTAGQEAAKAAAERDAVAATKGVDANRTLSLLDEAEKLIPLSTGSAGGNAVDQIAALGGLSTGGAQAIAQLQTIAGQLTSAMPRMQGPQSDRDVQLYTQMAGDLANPKKPRETRMKALQTIRALNKKYASQQASSGARRLKYNPATGKVE